MIINKKVSRTILESKAQYLGSIVLIVLSCLLYTLMNQTSYNTDSGTLAFVNDYVQEDASFVADKRLSNIAELESKFGLLIEEGESFDYAASEERTLRVFAEMTKVNKYAVIEGKPLAGNDTLVDPAYAKANHIDIGDTIDIHDRKFKVTGFMSLPNYIYPVKKETDVLNSPGSFGIAVIGKDDFTEFQTDNRFYSVKVVDDEGDEEHRLEELKSYLKNEQIVILKWTNTNENPRVTLATAKMNNMKNIGSLMPVAILLLTCLLTAVVMRRMMKREAVIIGTLYAQGYRKSEIMSHYLWYPSIVAAAGGIAGTALGLAALNPMLTYMVGYFNIPIASVKVNTAHLAISLLLPIVLLLASVYITIRKSLGHTPVQLLRGGEDTRKVGFIERRLNLNKLKFSTKFKVREQLRSIPRSIFLLLGVTMATMLLLLGFTLKSSMDFLMKDTYEAAYKFKHEYWFNKLQEGKPMEGGEAFSAAPFMRESGDNDGFTVYGVEPSSQSLSFKDPDGKPLTFDKVIVTKPLADRLKIKLHEPIEIAGKLDSKSYTITIEAIADSYIGEFIYLPLSAFNEMLGYPADSYLGLWSQQPLELAEDSLLSTSSSDELQQAFKSLTGPMQAMFGVISILSFIIGLFVIYVVTSLIIEENKDNISLMKVLGYRKKEVYSLILNSSTIIVLLGFIIGVPLLLSSLKAMYGSIAASTSFIMPVKVDYVYVAVGFVMIYLIFELSKALSKKKIARISMADALKSRVE
ncbi:FtsX-like permease family protein [Paenibacillus sp. NEAU-GSW1]|nr:FtsX-like permease family protein [Paenibacillus sp. NEAU-GSW1]